MESYSRLSHFRNNINYWPSAKVEGDRSSLNAVRSRFLTTKIFKHKHKRLLTYRRISILARSSEVKDSRMNVFLVQTCRQSSLMCLESSLSSAECLPRRR